MRAFLSFRRRKMAKRTERHKTRIGTSSGFAIHFRGAGVDQEKMVILLRRFVIMQGFHKQMILLLD